MGNLHINSYGRYEKETILFDNDSRRTSDSLSVVIKVHFEGTLMVMAAPSMVECNFEVEGDIEVTEDSQESGHRFVSISPTKDARKAKAGRTGTIKISNPVLLDTPLVVHVIVNTEVNSPRNRQDLEAQCIGHALAYRFFSEPGPSR